MPGQRPSVAGLFSPSPAAPAAGSLGQFKNWFFDSDKVKGLMSAKERKAMVRFGAIVMRAARKSIKTAPGTSAPGTPPHAHTTHVSVGKNGKAKKRVSFRDSILFAYDPFRKATVVGPYLFAGSRTGPTVPELLTFGGAVRHRHTVERYAPRPFMMPALRSNADKFAGLFRE